jgi:hypothetical protein
MEGPAHESMPQEMVTREVFAREESGVVLTQDVLARVETVATVMLLGTDGIHTDWAGPRPGDATRGFSPRASRRPVHGHGRVQPQS